MANFILLLMLENVMAQKVLKMNCVENAQDFISDKIKCCLLI